MFKHLGTVCNACFSFNREKRYAARHDLLSGIARRMGFRLYNRNLHWLVNETSLAEWKEFQPVARYITDRRFLVHSMARALAQLPGDMAECGTFDGGASYLICRAIEQSGRQRTHHIFDSFEGLSEPDQRDRPSDPTAYEWQAHDLSVSEATVRKNLTRFDFVKYYKGWIPDRFAEVAQQQFSFVHIDVDLYQPTFDSLTFFYDRMVPGGILLCDDYGSTVCPGAFDAMNEFFADKPESPPIHLPTGQGMIVKQGSMVG